MPWSVSEAEEASLSYSESADKSDALFTILSVASRLVFDDGHFGDKLFLFDFHSSDIFDLLVSEIDSVSHSVFGTDKSSSLRFLVLFNPVTRRSVRKAEGV
jgi:hypothetical protein